MGDADGSERDFPFPAPIVPFLEKEAMWLRHWQLREAGFNERSGGYWQCEQGFGLPQHAWVSIFAGNWATSSRRRRSSRQELIEVSAFHVTFQVAVDHIHFYYHETMSGAWEPGGHTSYMEICRHGLVPLDLRSQADMIADQVAAALHGRRWPRA